MQTGLCLDSGMTKRDLEQVAFVTRRFEQMRAGLAVAGIGPLFLIRLAALRSPAWVTSRSSPRAS